MESSEQLENVYMSDYLEQPGNSGTTGANLEQPGTTRVRPGKLGKVWDIEKFLNGGRFGNDRCQSGATGNITDSPG